MARRDERKALVQPLRGFRPAISASGIEKRLRNGTGPRRRRPGTRIEDHTSVLSPSL